LVDAGIDPSVGTVGDSYDNAMAESIEALQADLDEWLRQYNHERTHQGKICCVRTPIQTLIDGKEIWREKFIT
jgi:hypothetical protein